MFGESYSTGIEQQRPERNGIIMQPAQKCNSWISRNIYFYNLEVWWVARESHSSILMDTKLEKFNTSQGHFCHIVVICRRLRLVFLQGWGWGQGWGRNSDKATIRAENVREEDHNSGSFFKKLWRKVFGAPTCTQAWILVNRNYFTSWCALRPF